MSGGTSKCCKCGKGTRGERQYCMPCWRHIREPRPDLGSGAYNNHLSHYTVKEINERKTVATTHTQNRAQ